MMASATVTIGEYLRTSYSPDFEFLDGEIREKPVVSPLHSRAQVVIGVWFFQHEREWNLVAGVETRTRVSVGRVRLPDVAVGRPESFEGDALLVPPVIAMEILSASDSMMDLKRRAEDLEQMGVRNVWLIDPESRDAFVWRDGYWQKVGGKRIEALEDGVFLDLEWLWLQLRRG